MIKFEPENTDPTTVQKVFIESIHVGPWSTTKKPILLSMNLWEGTKLYYFNPTPYSLK